MSYSIAMYGVRLFGNDPDYYTAETETEAIALARKKLKERGWSGPHGVITEGGRLVATVVMTKDRVLTKRSRR